VTGDCHAGICGSPGVKFPRATRLSGKEGCEDRAAIDLLVANSGYAASADGAARVSCDTAGSRHPTVRKRHCPRCQGDGPSSKGNHAADQSDVAAPGAFQGSTETLGQTASWPGPSGRFPSRSEQQLSRSSAAIPRCGQGTGVRSVAGDASAPAREVAAVLDASHSRLRATAPNAGRVRQDSAREQE